MLQILSQEKVEQTINFITEVLDYEDQLPPIFSKFPLMAKSPLLIQSWFLQSEFEIWKNIYSKFFIFLIHKFKVKRLWQSSLVPQLIKLSKWAQKYEDKGRKSC